MNVYKFDLCRNKGKYSPIKATNFYQIGFSIARIFYFFVKLLLKLMHRFKAIHSF